MKKAFDQTVRDLKRGVNKKVLKVPSIEQKVLDATSNEPWGPHGTLLADIAQATKNYHEYQMIMSVLWKRINDTGKNWRHVYKALTVLEYLVAHGSERVIDDIREHAYQISTLSDFQYIDSSGKDQGNNVRKKSQSIVVLVNDKERIQEARVKAAANREKYRNTPAGGMYRPGSGSYGDRYDDDRSEGRSGYGNRDDDRDGYGREREWGSRDDDRDGYGREREWGSRDDDRYGRYGESYGREGDRYGRDSEERYGRDGYRDDDYNYSRRSRSADRDRNPANDDDGQYSNRGSGAKADDQYQDGGSGGKGHDRKNSGQNFSAPPSYEDAVGDNRSPPYSERDGESSAAYAPKASSTGASPSHITTTAAPTPSTAPPPASPPASASPPAPAQSVPQQSNNEVDGFDEFDPRGSFTATPPASNGTPPASAVEMDLLGSLSDSFSSNSMALVPTGQHDVETEADTSASFNSGPNASPASVNNNQPFGDPFGDGPFRAIPSTDSVPNQQQINTPVNSFSTNSSQPFGMPQPVPQEAPTEFGGPFGDVTYTPSGPGGQPPTNTQFPQQELSTPDQDIDILADILPPSTPPSFPSTQDGGYPVPPTQPPASHGGFPPQQTNQHELQSGLSSLSGQNAPENSFQQQTFPTQPPSQASYPLQSMGSVSQTGYPSQTMALTYPVQAGQPTQMGFHQPNPSHSNYYGAYQPQPTSMGAGGPYMGPPSSTGPTVQHNFHSTVGPMGTHMGHQAPQVPAPITQASAVSSAIVPVASNDKFETKSTVWADTLSRGLVNLNISGSKTNPLANIGVDFDAINRREKRMEKPTTTTVTSTVTMGKAMGSGSGVGRAGATALRPAPNQMMNPNMNYGMAGGAPGGMGMGMGGYGGNQQTGRGMGMGMNMPGNMGMNMPGNMGMNMPGNMGMGMNMPGNMGMGMNMPGNMGMGMNMPGNMGMGQGTNMQQPMGPPGSMPQQGYNPMMGPPGNYGQQPYNGGYR